MPNPKAPLQVVVEPPDRANLWDRKGARSWIESLRKTGDGNAPVCRPPELGNVSRGNE